ncbi:hypothetical protein BGC07_01900 [Piscirickettsia litoralis]|uniref:Transcriptional regulator TetR C-terminal Proteobacteria type domain-containing protein n=2 Tax=Piscirickettsia litoralis TaxID=1891921 RepID=A0ABX3A0G2_9GAMM|nr:hypothetical protein BGC07_01900 [Piscirickettsia litoralis]
MDYFKIQVKKKRLKIDHIEIATSQFIGLTKEHLYWPVMLGFSKKPSSAEQEETIQQAISLFLTQYKI